MIDLINGEIINSKYEVAKNLGRGGMATVWLAKDLENDIDVAIKIINSEELVIKKLNKLYDEGKLPGYKQNGNSGAGNHLEVDLFVKQVFSTRVQFQEVFFREIRAMKRLAGHSNVVAILDSGVCKREKSTELIYYIVMEFIDGSSLNRFNLDRDDYRKCLKIALKICKAVDYAHKKEVLHRDIKPANILITEDTVVKVTDFGLAKIMAEGEQYYTLPTAGTKGIMAPEQVQGKATKQSDIYQLGGTLFYLFTGEFSLDEARTANQLNPKLSARLSLLIQKMLGYNVTERPELSDVIDCIQQEAYLDPRVMSRYRDPVVSIRISLKERVEKEIISLKDSIHELTPVAEYPVWYATVLLRPFLPNSSRKLADYFNLIYFAEFTDSEVTGVAGWDDDFTLAHKKLDIDKCCSGLPILWYNIEESRKWEKRGNYNNNCIFQRADGGSSDLLDGVILLDVKNARFDPKTQPNLISDTYATADAVKDWRRAVGWNMRDPKTRQLKLMSQNIQTELLVPIYHKDARNLPFREIKNAILGVINFEWDQTMNEKRVIKILNSILGKIRNKDILNITEFTCEVLYNTTLPEDE